MRCTFAFSLLILACLPDCPLPAQIPPDQFAAHIQSAQMAAHSGLPVIAAREYRAALALHPRDTDALFALGGVLEQAGQKNEAMTCYREVIRLRPDFAPAHNALAGVLEDTGQTAPALAQRRQALALEPNNARLHFNLAATLEDAGQQREALAEYREALRLQPDFAEAQAAVRDETERVSTSPAPNDSSVRAEANYETLFRRGLALEAAGRVAEAIAAFHAVLMRQPRNAAVHLHLGIALYADGQTVPAHREWKTVLGLPDPSASAQAQRLLETYP